MTPFNHQINARHLTTFAPLVNELTFDRCKNYLFDLSYLTGIHVAGERSEEFLQGQLTCDLKEVSLQQCRQGALCNLKGRILALIDVVNWEKHGLQLIVPSDLLHETNATLSKTAMFSRVTLHHETSFKIFGLYLQNRDDIIPFDVKLPTETYSVVSQESYCCYYLGNNLYIFLVKTEHASTCSEKFIRLSQWRGSLAWHALQLQNKQIEIYPLSRGLFLPHRIDLQHKGYLSFNKGCYKGQEIIARTHYRAKLKHELRVFRIQTEATLRTGQRLFNPDGMIEIGELIDYCPIDCGKYLIAASVVFQTPTIICIEENMGTVALEVVM